MKNVYSAIDRKSLVTLQCDLMRYPDPANAEKCILEYIERQTPTRGIHLEYSALVSREVTSLAVMHPERVTRFYTIDESKVCGRVTEINYNEQYGRFNFIIQSVNQKLVPRIDKNSDIITLVRDVTNQANGQVIRCLVSNEERVFDHRIHCNSITLEHSKAPRALTPAQVPSGMTYAMALTLVITHWIRKVYTVEKWHNTNEAQQRAIVYDVLGRSIPTHVKKFIKLSVCLIAMIDARLTATPFIADKVLKVKAAEDRFQKTLNDIDSFVQIKAARNKKTRNKE